MHNSVILSCTVFRARQGSSLSIVMLIATFYPLGENFASIKWWMLIRMRSRKPPSQLGPSVGQTAKYLLGDERMGFDTRVAKNSGYVHGNFHGLRLVRKIIFPSLFFVLIPFTLHQVAVSSDSTIDYDLLFLISFFLEILKNLFLRIFFYFAFRFSKDRM